MSVLRQASSLMSGLPSTIKTLIGGTTTPSFAWLFLTAMGGLAARAAAAAAVSANCARTAARACIAAAFLPPGLVNVALGETFADSGSRTPGVAGNGLDGVRSIGTGDVDLDGSAGRVLDVSVADRSLFFGWNDDDGMTGVVWPRRRAAAAAPTGESCGFAALELALRSRSR